MSKELHTAGESQSLQSASTSNPSDKFHQEIYGATGFASYLVSNKTEGGSQKSSDSSASHTKPASKDNGNGGFLEIPPLDTNGLKPADPSQKSQKPEKPGTNEHRVNPEMAKLMAAGAAVAASAAALHTDVQQETIDPSGVRQGQYGDCFFESSLSSLANSAKGQQMIRDMVSKNQDGSFTVSFPGDRDHPVTVTAEDLKKSGTVDKANWANVIETAFLKYDDAGPFTTSLIDKLKNENIPMFASVATDEEALHLLTNETTTGDQFSTLTLGDRQIGIGSTSKENVAQNIQEALANGEPITAGANDGFMKYLGDHDSGPMVGDHVYSVLSYDPKTGNVVVRNPWGSNDGTPFAKDGATADGITSLGDGKLSMSLDTFMQRFSTMAIAGKNPYANDLENVGTDWMTTGSDIAQAGKDIWNGNPTKAAGDLWQGVKDFGTTQVEEVRSVTDVAERGVKDLVSIASDSVVAVGNAEVKLAISAGNALKSGWNTVASWF